MNALLKSVVTMRGREAAVKESLIAHLSDSVKQIQIEQTQQTQSVDAEDATSSLCTVLEAIFIHGLKDTFMNRITQAIGSDPDQRPEPNFWGPLLIFSHREIIDQVASLNLITTDVGRCRAWLRLAINESLLSSYFEAMRQENNAFKPYYKRSAFIRDVELLDVSQRLIEGIETCPILLACNSSLLNTWTNAPILMAGLWMPPMKSCPVAPAVDIASTLECSLVDPSEDSASSLISLSSSSGIGQVLACNEDEAFKIILDSPIKERTLANSIKEVTDKSCSGFSCTVRSHENDSGGTDIPHRQDKDDSTFCDEDGPSSVGNSLIGRVGWSSSFEEIQDSKENNSEDNISESQNVVVSHKSVVVTQTHNKVTLLRSPSEGQSYHSLLESYNLVSGGYVKTPDLRDFLHRFENSVDSAGESVSGEMLDDSEFRKLVQQIGKIAREPGLDSQNYSCVGCGHPVGIGLGKARFCHFIGGYFCLECHVGEESVIPARVVHNWDFRPYQISRKAAEFLDEIKNHPLLDLKVINPRLYLAVEDMAQIQALRHQLNLLRAYLFTCREPVIEDLQKRVWPREYLYEHVHLYSFADLLQIQSGALSQLLQKVVLFAKSHVLSCWLCCQKGFICEVCNNPKVIYPFDMDSTYRCGICSAVFHVGCLNATTPCPKCKRRQKRDDGSESINT